VINFDLTLWKEYCANPDFRKFLNGCRHFDPIGFDQALKRDENSNVLEFRRVIVEAYRDDLRVMAVGQEPNTCQA